MKIVVIWPGKIKNQHIEHIAEDYCKKIEKMARFQIVHVKENKFDAVRKLKEEKKLIDEKILPNSFIVVLDSKGKSGTTEDLLKLVNTQMNHEGRNLVFISGGHIGLHDELKAKAHLLLALSPLDLPHELCRVMLLEQIYRVLCILHKIPYPK